MKHSLANYPKQFLGCVVSPTKICLQFEEVDTKLRFKEGAEYIKLPSTHKAIAISPLGTDIDLLSVGCQMPVLEEALLSAVNALSIYKERHADTYLETYEKPLEDFLFLLKESVNKL